jgi:outer membrane lipoprotein-sorting protein
MHRLPFRAAALVICSVLSGGAARAEDSPGDLAVKQMDDAMTTRAKDQEFEFDLIILEPGKAERNLVFKVNIKGRHWRRLEFLAPGDVKGMRTLVLSVNQMYVYLPAFRKVRRVASHVRDQGFMGSAYSYDEMAIVTYGDVFSAKLVSENDQAWVLELTRRPGQEFSYPKVDMVIDKKVLQPTSIKYYSDKGALLKSEVRSDYECQSGVCNPKLMVLTDHTRNNLVSKMVRRKWRLNVGTPDSFFTQRDLQKGN